MQSTNNIFLIRPSNFVFNSETSASNTFQVKTNESGASTGEKALKEFEIFATTLKSNGLNVFIFDDTPFPEKPDAVFPNNWVTFHAGGLVILYPMSALNRQHERRNDIIDLLKKKFKVTDIVDLSIYEKENRFLEGTGSIVFDHVNKIAYASLSPRTDKEIFLIVSKKLGYKPVCFHSYDKNGNEIYHTNVMMCIGEKFAVICLDSISDSEEKESVKTLFCNSGHKIIDISHDQMNNFAGNMLALQNDTGETLLALSQRACDSLTSNQKSELEKYAELVPLDIRTIETVGGGSARCMIAEIFLEPIHNS